MMGQVALVFSIGLPIAMSLPERLRQAEPGRLEVGIAPERFAVVSLPGERIVDFGATIDFGKPEEGSAVVRGMLDPAIDHSPGFPKPISSQIDPRQRLVNRRVGIGLFAPETGEDRLRLVVTAEPRQGQRVDPFPARLGAAQVPSLVQFSRDLAEVAFSECDFRQEGVSLG
jgi:hypothetical protein